MTDKAREEEYLEKLGLPTDDYSSVEVKKEFSIDDILREVSGKPEEPAAAAPAVKAEKPAPKPEKPEAPIEKAAKPVIKPEKPELPTAKAEKPVIKPELPTAKAEKPAKKPEAPAVETAKPTTAPEKPIEKAAKPTAAPEKPIEKAEKPTAAPEAPIEKAAKPTAAPEAPIEKTAKPTAAPEAPIEKTAKLPKKPEKPSAAAAGARIEELKLFSTIEIEKPTDEYKVAVEEGGEAKIDGSTVVFAPQSQSPSAPRPKRQPRKVHSEAEPEQMVFEGAEPYRNVITLPREEPAETAPSDKVADSFGESIENRVREEARKAFRLTGGEEENAPSEEPEPIEEFDDYEEPEDFEQIETDLKLRKTDTIFKTLFVTAGTLLLLILGIFRTFGTGDITAEKDMMIIYLFVNAVVSAVVLLLCAGIVRRGILQLVRMSPGAEASAVICFAAAIVQNVMLMANTEPLSSGAVGVYNFIPAMMMLFIKLGELQTIRRTRGNMEFVNSNGSLSAAVMLDDEELTEDLSAGQISGEAHICAARHTDRISDLIKNSTERCEADRTLARVLPVLFALCAIITLLSKFIRGIGVAEAFSVFTAALCSAAPLMTAFVTVMPLSRINKRLNAKGGAIVSFDAAMKLAEANGVVISDTDIFPANTITLHGISLFNNAPLDAVLTDTISVLNAADGALAKVFEGSVADRSLLREIDSMEYVDEMGMICKSAGREILLGSRNFMKAYQIPVSSAIYESRVSGSDKHVFYLAADMQLCAMFVVSYAVNEVSERRLRRAENNGLTLLVATKDTNVTKEILANRMKLEAASVKVICARALDRLERSFGKAKSLPAGVLVNDESCALTEAVVCSSKLKSSVVFNLAAVIASAFIGLIFVAVFALLPSASAIAAWKILVYALFWTLPVLLLSSSNK